VTAARPEATSAAAVAKRVDAVSRLLAPLVMAAACVALWPFMALLWREWMDHSSSYSHGPLLLLGVLWLMWRGGVAPARLGPGAIVVLASACLALGFALAAGASAVVLGPTSLLWPAAVLASLWLLCGWRGLQPALVPVSLLLFAVPVWSPVRDHLLWPATVSIVPALVTAIGVPADVQGVFVHIPQGTFEIASECSGEHYFLVFVVLAVFVGHLESLSLGRRALLVAVAGAFAMLLNWIRVAAIILIGAANGMSDPIVRDHGWFGTLVFGFGLACYLWWALRHRGPERRAAGRAVGVAAAMHAVPGRTELAVRCGLGAVALAVGSLAVGHADVPEAQRERMARSFGAVFAGTAARPVAAESIFRPSFPGADLQAAAQWGEGAEAVFGYQNAFFAQMAGREIVSGQSQLLDPQAKIFEERVAGGTIATGEPGYREATVMDPAGRRWLVRSAHIADGLMTGSAFGSQLLLARAALRRRPGLGGVLALATRCDDAGCSAAAERLRGLWPRVAPGLLRLFEPGE
jgi:exosortase